MANIFAPGGNELALKKDIPNPNLLYGTPLNSNMKSPINSGDSKYFYYVGTTNYDFVAFQLSSFKKGDVFTFSGIVNITGNQDTGKYRLAIYNKSLGQNYIDDYVLNSGKYDSLTIKVNADSDNQNPPYLLIYAGEAGKTMGNSMNGNYVKLEKGNFATPWLPSVDDLVSKSDLDDLKKQIEQLKSK